MPEWIVPALLGLLLIAVLLILWRVLLPVEPAGVDPRDTEAIHQALRGLEAQLSQVGERLDRSLRDEMARQAGASRNDLARLQQLMLTQVGEASRTQNDQIDTLRVQLASMQQQVNDALMRLTEGNERRLGEVRDSVNQRLAALQEGNERKLEQMRATVDEKLQATLEQRLGHSFRQVAERLEQVHQGLGEMRGLARDVGSLNRVLTNVKTRGTFGEVQLAGLLEQVFTPEQYGRNVETVPGSGARVEFALKLPGRQALQGTGPAVDGSGRTEDPGAPVGPVWLPIDAKFPREDHERLIDAQERADAPAAEAAGRALEQRLKLEARSIREKYVAVPHTTDFAILFLPTEGLYAEALRRPGLAEALQREHRVTLAGPTTLLALLNSLQMGFRTLALEQRSAQVWQVLGAVKTEFAKFGEALVRTRRKLDEAASSIDAAEVRTRQMTRRLQQVEALPADAAAALLPGLASPPGDPEATGLPEERTEPHTPTDPDERIAGNARPHG